MSFSMSNSYDVKKYAGFVRHTILSVELRITISKCMTELFGIQIMSTQYAQELRTP